MAKNELYSLQWNDFHQNISEGLISFMEDENLVDVTLAAEGKFIQAHKLVLSVSSPYFKDLFKVNPCKHPIVVLKDVLHSELLAIIQFMYKGQVHVQQDELANFLKTAESLQVKGLAGNNVFTSLAARKPATSQSPVLPLTQRRYQNNSQIQQTDLCPSPSGESELAGPSSLPFKRLRVENETSIIPLNRTPSFETVIIKEELEETPVGLEDEKSQDFLYSIFNEDEQSQLLQHDLSQAEDEGSDAQDSGSFAGVSQDPSTDDDINSEGRLKFIANNRGNCQLVYAGHIYNVNRQIGNRKFWRCSAYRSQGCRGRCISQNSKLLPNGVHKHNHGTREEIIRRKLPFILEDVPVLSQARERHQVFV